MADAFNGAWIKANAREVLAGYTEGITLRQLYYRLVARGMTNDVQHYKKVVSTMTSARWEGVVRMEAFVDRERSMWGRTDADTTDLSSAVEQGKRQIKAWMQNYNLERWSTQPKYVEVWIEKKALQGVFERPCMMMDVGLAPCKGYPSLTFLNDARRRFEEAQERGQEVIILYFGDYDPSGEDIPRSIKENIGKMGCEVEVIRMALTPEQIQELGLPGVPPKVTDSRTRNWAGDAVVELDAVEPKTLQTMCTDAIEEHFDYGIYESLKELEKEEKAQYVEALKEYVNGLGEDDLGKED